MLSWLIEEIGPRPLGLARVGVGLAAIVKALITAPVLLALTRDDLLRTPNFIWFPEPVSPLVWLVLATWVISATLLAIGWKVSVSGTVLTLTIAFTLALDQQLYSNHLYLLGWLTLLMTIADAGAGLNVSRVDRPVVRWPVILLMAQLSIVYGFSALSKINPDFLRGEVLAGELRGGLVPFPETLITPPLMAGLAAVVIAVEAALALLIWRARFRPYVFALGLGLHLSITFFMSATGQLAVFSLEMLSLYPLFLTGHPLEVSRKAECAHCARMEVRLRRHDVLEILEIASEEQQADLRLFHHGRVTTGADAHTRILEHLVPWLWLASLLRLPVVRELHRRRHDRIYRLANSSV
ncbi:MAG: HTTM domain-containing protein [Actinomycetota bacterium]